MQQTHKRDTSTTKNKVRQIIYVFPFSAHIDFFSQTGGAPFNPFQTTKHFQDDLKLCLPALFILIDLWARNGTLKMLHYFAGGKAHRDSTIKYWTISIEQPHLDSCKTPYAKRAVSQHGEKESINHGQQKPNID